MDLFVSSPFSIVAHKEHAGCWAGRDDVRVKLVKLCRSYSRRGDSSFNLIWANLGAGKTHALYHLAHLLEGSQTDASVVLTTFVEMPENIRQFIDLYRRIVAGLPLKKIAEHVISGNGLNANLVRAANGLINGSHREMELAVDWLLGRRPNLRDLKSGIGIDCRIEDDTLAGDILSDIVRAGAQKKTRILVLLDEFQRVGLLPARNRDVILSTIRSSFSKNPEYFSIVVAVASRVEQTALDLVPAELRTLMGMRPSISLPEMSTKEALEFVLGRFACFRPEGYSGAEGAPFTREALELVLSHIDRHEGVKMIPRTILQVLGIVYDEIMERPERAITPTELESLLSGLSWED